MPKSAKGASRTLSEAVKALKINPDAPFSAEQVQQAIATVMANLNAVRYVKDGRNEYREVADDATRQKAAEMIIRLGCMETTVTEAQTEAQTQEDDHPPKRAEALPPIPPALERRILEDRLSAIQKSPEMARS